jgi:hypothetical protein
MTTRLLVTFANPRRTAIRYLGDNESKRIGPPFVALALEPNHASRRVAGAHAFDIPLVAKLRMQPKLFLLAIEQVNVIVSGKDQVIGFTYRLQIMPTRVRQRERCLAIERRRFRVPVLKRIAFQHVVTDPPQPLPLIVPHHSVRRLKRSIPSWFFGDSEVKQHQTIAFFGNRSRNDNAVARKCFVWLIVSPVGASISKTSSMPQSNNRSVAGLLTVTCWANESVGDLRDNPTARNAKQANVVIARNFDDGVAERFTLPLRIDGTKYR